MNRQVVTDYGLIIRAQSPFTSRNQTVILYFYMFRPFWNPEDNLGASPHQNLKLNPGYSEDVSEFWMETICRLHRSQILCFFLLYVSAVGYTRITI